MQTDTNTPLEPPTVEGFMAIVERSQQARAMWQAATPGVRTRVIEAYTRETLAHPEGTGVACRGGGKANTLWIATHQHSPEDTAMAFGQTAQEAAELIAARFPKAYAFGVGLVKAGGYYPTEDALNHRYLAKRQPSGALALTALAEEDLFSMLWP